jgi:hypothetical protein
MTPAEIQDLVDHIARSYQSFTIVSVIVSPLICGIAAYFGAYLKKKAENLAQKEDITQITKAIEDVKEDVRLLGRKQEIHYNYYFQEKAKALGQIYGRLSALQRDLRSAVQNSALIGTPLPRQWYDCRDKIWETKNLIDDSRIFLEEPLVQQLNELIDQFMGALSNVGGSATSPVNATETTINAVQNALTASGTIIPETLRELASTFRKHIEAPTSQGHTLEP